MKFKCKGLKFLERGNVVVGVSCVRKKGVRPIRVELEIPKKYRI